MIKALEQKEYYIGNERHVCTEEQYCENLKKADELRAFSAAEALHGALDMPTERMDRRAELRLGKILRKLDYTSGGVRVNGAGAKPVRRWRKKDWS